MPAAEQLATAATLIQELRDEVAALRQRERGYINEIMILKKRLGEEAPPQGPLSAALTLGVPLKGQSHIIDGGGDLCSLPGASAVYPTAAVIPNAKDSQDSQVTCVSDENCDISVSQRETGIDLTTTTTTTTTTDAYLKQMISCTPPALATLLLRPAPTSRCVTPESDRTTISSLTDKTNVICISPERSPCRTRQKRPPPKEVPAVKKANISNDEQKENVEEELFPIPERKKTPSRVNRTPDWVTELTSPINKVINNCVSVQRRRQTAVEESKVITLSPIKRSRSSVASKEVKQNVTPPQRSKGTPLIDISQILLDNDVQKKKDPQTPCALPPAGSVISPIPVTSKFKARNGPVRRKEDRQSLTAVTCGVCKQFFNALDIPENVKDHHLQQHGRHRCECPPSCTPPGFWDHDPFID